MNIIYFINKGLKTQVSLLEVLSTWFCCCKLQLRVPSPNNPNCSLFILHTYYALILWFVHIYSFDNCKIFLTTQTIPNLSHTRTTLQYFDLSIYIYIVLIADPAHTTLFLNFLEMLFIGFCCCRLQLRVSSLIYGFDSCKIYLTTQIVPYLSYTCTTL